MLGAGALALPASPSSAGTAGLLERLARSGRALRRWTGRALSGGLGRGRGAADPLHCQRQINPGDAAAGAGEGRAGGRITPGGWGLSLCRWGRWAGGGRAGAVGEAQEEGAR